MKHKKRQTVNTRRLSSSPMSMVSMKSMVSMDPTFPFWSWMVVLLLGLLIGMYILRPRDLERIFENFVVKNSTIELSPAEKEIISSIQKDTWDDDNSNDHHSTEKDKQVLDEIYQRLLEVHPFTKNLSLKHGQKSYSINKKQVYLCLKDEQGEHYAMNMLMYVALHELAHCMCDEIGHTPKFHEIFNHLLDIAHEKNVYDKTIEPLSSYCNYASSN